MFTIIFDKKIKMPLYNQLYQFLKMEISTGRLAPGEKLPSKRKLAAHLKISQNTIETAYGQLQAEGYITALPKRGFFVEEISDLLPLQSTKTKQAQQNIKSPEQAAPVKTNQGYLYDFRTAGRQEGNDCDGKPDSAGFCGGPQVHFRCAVSEDREDYSCYRQSEHAFTGIPVQSIPAKRSTSSGRTFRMA